MNNEKYESIIESKEELDNQFIKIDNSDYDFTTECDDEDIEKN